MRVLPATRRRCLGLALVAAAAGLGLAGAVPSAASPPEVRPPAVAGQFYPASPETLKAALADLLRDARAPRVGRPIALVVPHAGYVYSGPIAADAFRQAAGHRYRVVVILGTNHTAPGFRRIGIAPGGGFRTPLGTTPIDQDLVRALLAESPDCTLDGSVHAREHSIEVQLPFVQHLFPEAQIVPAVVGSPDLELCRRFGTALAKILAGREALIVASSDLSHYPSATDAERVDARTLEALVRMDPGALQSTLRASLRLGIDNLDTGACGEAPMLAALVAARALGATRGVVISYAHSGRTLVGDSARVVGYGAVALFAGDKAAEARPEEAEVDVARLELRPGDEVQLLSFAREAIRRFLVTETLPLSRGLDPRLGGRQGVFVTLRKAGQLRGCIGSVVPAAPLGQLVGAMALRAAFADPRFPPLALEELPAVELEISLLSPPHRVVSDREIAPGRDGVILEKDGKAAVFLPQVATEQGWGRHELLDNLCFKAGLTDDCWSEGAALSVFQARVFRERG
jgi:AmmeMemoRadiSam system protein B/AmmeMemoRadiSam system protein A